jgi:hypothetical protein
MTNRKGARMAKAVTVEAYYLSLTAARGLPESEYRAIRRTLTRSRFRERLRGAVRAFIARHPSLARVRVALTR